MVYDAGFAAHSPGCLLLLSASTVAAALLFVLRLLFRAAAVVSIRYDLQQST